MIPGDGPGDQWALNLALLPELHQTQDTVALDSEESQTSKEQTFLVCLLQKTFTWILDGEKPTEKNGIRDQTWYGEGYLSKDKLLPKEVVDKHTLTSDEWEAKVINQKIRLSS